MFVGMKNLSSSSDCLRYSLVPSEKMLLSSINRYNDSKRKCLDEYGINVHKAGQNEKSVTVGVPRFQELLNATKTPKIVNCKIFLNEGNENIQELRDLINHQIVCLTLKDISDTIEINLNKEDEWWYDIFKILYNNDFEELEHCISITLNKKLLFKYRLSLEDIAKKISAKKHNLKIKILYLSILITGLKSLIRIIDNEIGKNTSFIL